MGSFETRAAREMEVAIMRKGGATLSALIRFLTSFFTIPTLTPIPTATPPVTPPPVNATPSIPPSPLSVKGVVKAELNPPDLIHLLTQLISLTSSLDVHSKVTDNGVRDKSGHKTDVRIEKEVIIYSFFYSMKKIYTEISTIRIFPQQSQHNI